jgi:hypothetical protein
MKLIKLLLIVLFCTSLLMGAGCNEKSVNPDKSGETGEGPPPEGGME